MSLKVIGGEFRGRNLQSVRGQGTRPLLGQVREALFNILGDWVQGKQVWDLFAGTGASGIEALSRGAARVHFVEKSNQALKVLRANLQLLGAEVGARYTVHKVDAWNPVPLIDAPSKVTADDPADDPAEDDADVDDAEDGFDLGADEVADDPDDPAEATVDLPQPGVEVPPDLVFLDPPYKAVTEDPTRAAYLAQRLLDRVAPGGVICFHFLDGSLDRDDFDESLTVEIRRWGKSAVALIGRPSVADSDPAGGLVTDTAYEL